MDSSEDDTISNTLTEKPGTAHVVTINLLLIKSREIKNSNMNCLRRGLTKIIF